jgi:hypothetical protein
VISWITHLLTGGYLLFEIYLLAVRRGLNAVTKGDQGTLRLVWILIAEGCLVGFLWAPNCNLLRLA